MASLAGYPAGLQASARGKQGEPPCAGRTIQIVSDLSLAEQLYLLERARRMKERNTNTEPVEAPPLCEILDADENEKLDSEDSTVYLVFMEGSTRTKESLRNAAIWHGVKVNEFQAETSSFQKNETITDTMKMLAVYSTKRSVFVIRSPLEGVCSWLQTVLPAHAERYGIQPPAFLNAGDGRYSHPLNEYVDMFTLLEQSKWDRSAIHIALVGDLAHGRTAHSKKDGLQVFHNVKVDLIAPDLFEYQVEHRNRMRASGFTVREFGSIEEYVEKAADSLATIWYFYQPQFKRCGDMPEETQREYAEKVTFRPEWESKMKPGTCFFQTLPRDKENPIIPLSLDDTRLNGWDRHANNAYFIHVVLLGMLFGKIGYGIPQEAPMLAMRKSPSYSLLPVDEGKGMEPKAASPPVAKKAVDILGGEPARCPFSAKAKDEPLPSWIEGVDIAAAEHKRRPERAKKAGVVPVTDGLVIDHVGINKDPDVCWKRLRMARNVMGWSIYVGSEGVYDSSSHAASGKLFKGMMTFPNLDFEEVTIQQMKALASIAPGCTVNAVRASTVVGKYRLRVPERIYNLPNIRCSNPRCVSFPLNKQRDVVAFFKRVPFFETSALPHMNKDNNDEYLFTCKYCNWPHQYEKIFADLAGKTLQDLFPVEPSL